VAAGAKRGRQLRDACAELAQDLVAGRVPVPGVEAPKAVDVGDEQEAPRLAVGGLGREGQGGEELGPSGTGRASCRARRTANLAEHRRIIGRPRHDRIPREGMAASGLYSAAWTPPPT